MMKQFNMKWFKRRPAKVKTFAMSDMMGTPLTPVAAMNFGPSGIVMPESIPSAASAFTVLGFDKNSNSLDMREFVTLSDGKRF